MATHKDPSRSDAWLRALGGFPLWASCIALAAASHFFFHALAMRPYLILTDVADMRSALPSIVVDGLVRDLEYLVPLLLLLTVPLARWIAAAGIDGEAPQTSIAAGDFELLAGEGLRPQRVAVHA